MKNIKRIINKALGGQIKAKIIQNWCRVPCPVIEGLTEGNLCLGMVALCIKRNS